MNDILPIQHLFLLTACIFVVIVKTVAVVDDDVFATRPRVMDIQEGVNGKLLCNLKAEYEDQFAIEWLHNNETIIPDNKMFVEPGGLQIPNVNNEHHSGTFQCVARSRTDPSDVRKTEPIRLNIKWLRPGAVILRSPAISALPLLPTMEVVLKCNITGNPSLKKDDITWYKNEEVLANKDPRISFKGERIVISNVTVEKYNGEYKCCAENTFGTVCSTKGYHLSVRDVRVPLLTEAPEAQVVLVNHDARFVCKFESEPPPKEIVWSKSNTKLPTKSSDDKNCKYCIEEEGQILTIKSVKEKLTGDYKCTATGVNDDETSGSASLKIAFLKPFHETYERRYLDQSKSEEVVCEVPDSLPLADISWYRRGKLKTNSGVNSTMHTAVTHKVLIIELPFVTDEGEYECRASNIFGSVSKIYNLTITVDPKITTELKDQTVNEGENVLFHCVVTGVPLPDMQWYHNGTRIQHNARHVIIDYKLSIPKVDLSDRGEYKCVAESIHTTTAKATSSATLKVIELMKLTPKPEDTCIEEGKRGVIKCGVRGADNPSLSWRAMQQNPQANFKIKQDKEFENTKNLIFMRASVNDEGSYSCQAVDSGQTLVQKIKVTVEKRPVIKSVSENATEFKGKKIELNCQADAELSVTWMVQSKIDHSNYTEWTTSHHIRVDRDGTLSISQAELSDTGWYTCCYTRCNITVNTSVYITIADTPYTEPGSGRESMNKKVQTIAFAVGSAVAYVLITLTVVIYCRRKKNSQADKSRDGENGDRELILSGHSLTNGHSKSNGEIPMEVLSKLPADIEQYVYDVNKLEVVTTIGRGEFGTVFLSKAPGLLPDIDDEVLVMVKQLDADSNSEYLQTRFNREVAVLKRANHDNIVQLLGVCCTENPINPSHLITEYLEWGILKLCLEASGQGKVGKFGKSTMMHMCCQLASALEHLTRLNVAHRDVAARNCVISSKLVVKLSMLSFSREGFENEYYHIDAEYIPIRWSAPESIQNRIYSTKSDIWSFGVTCWEIFSLGRLPYNEIKDEQLMKALHSDCLPVLPQLNNSKRITSLITKCCNPNAALRPEFYQIVRKLQSIIHGGANGTSTTASVVPTEGSEAGPLLPVQESEAPCSSRKTVS